MTSPVDPRERFSGAADRYARFRPSYPDSLVDWVVADAGLQRGEAAADVGCGTGLFTRLLAARGIAVTGLDPNEDMLARARSAGRERYLRGEAAATGLPAASVALVTVAQAFHWIPLDPALAEFARILRPGGRVAAVWNLRGRGGLMDDYDGLLRRFSREYGVVESWEETLRRLQAHPGIVRGRDFETDNAQSFDLEGLRGRAWSSSYVFRGIEDREGFDAALARLFATHACDGRIEFRYRAVAFAFSPRGT